MKDPFKSLGEAWGARDPVLFGQLAALIHEHRDELGGVLAALQVFSESPTGKAIEHIDEADLGRLRAILPPDITLDQLLDVISVGAGAVAKRASEQGRASVSQRHDKTNARWGGTEGKHEAAVSLARELWATYKSTGKSKTAVYADVATSFGVSAGTVKGWVSKAGGIEAT